MIIKNLDARLSVAAEYVRQDAVFADIGCDHAYLPVFLLKSGRIKRAICADIAEKPLQSAKTNVAENGLSDFVDFYLTDGLFGLDGLGITDISICGMGGELITDILNSAEFVKNEKINLILQPMTRQADLRRYLAYNGFVIKEECVAVAAKKIYFCILASYVGTPYEISDMEAELGAYNIKNPTPLFLTYAEKKAEALEKIAEGKAISDTDSAYESGLVLRIRTYLRSFL